MNLNNINILAETDQFLLGNIYEQVYLIQKSNDFVEEIGAMYGDAECGLIDTHGNWCIVGGESVLIWMQGKTTHLTNPNLRWVTRMRQVDDKTIHLLTDPWSDDPAILKLDMRTLQTYKVSGFNQMKNQPYTDSLEW